MFKRSKRDVRNDQNQDANRTINKILTFGLLAFLFYMLIEHNKKPELRHFDFTHSNYTPVIFPPLLKVKNAVNGEENYFLLKNGQDIELGFKPSELNKIKTNDEITLYQIKYVGK